MEKCTEAGQTYFTGTVFVYIVLYFVLHCAYIYPVVLHLLSRSSDVQFMAF